MYHFLKQILKNLIPDSVYNNHKEKLRRVSALIYKGNNVYCNVCQKRYRKFVSTTTNSIDVDLLCPGCGSLPRTRFLMELLSSEFATYSDRVLHFSPHKKLYLRLKDFWGAQYSASEFLNNEFELSHDICNIQEDDGSFGFIICFHVLEHIQNDDLAMSELFRVLKSGGVIFLQVPFKVGSTYENPDVITPQDRLKHFGQEDHVRVYGKTDFIIKLESNGFVVSEVNSKKDRNVVIKAEKP